MRILVTKDYDELSRKLAEIVVALIKKKPNMIFCLPAGASPIGMYEVLVHMYQNKEVDFKDMITFDMDEYVGIDATNEHSYAYFMKKHFLNYVNVNPKNVFYPDTLRADIDTMCEEYSEHMFSLGGLDLAITGIGDDGHMAFNEPDCYLLPRTHAVQLKPSTVKANARFFQSIDEVPPCAVSIGMEDIMRSKTFLVVASGEKKAPLIEKLFANDHIDPMYPVSFVRLHPNALLVIDEAAAANVDPAILRKFQS